MPERAWDVRVVFLSTVDPEFDRDRAFRVVAHDAGDAEYEALSLARDTWKPSRRFGLELGVYQATVVPVGTEGVARAE